MNRTVTTASTIRAGDTVFISHHAERVQTKISVNGKTRIVSIDADNHKHDREFHDMQPITVQRCMR